MAHITPTSNRPSSLQKSIHFFFLTFLIPLPPPPRLVAHRVIPLQYVQYTVNSWPTPRICLRFFCSFFFVTSLDLSHIYIYTYTYTYESY
ncbi:hypothetical protein L218DRAFT_408067 [Marasmius fiardii PR-910]|nr:hypothetical protein L218DRAFT_408067 [Marasmius fiardii PR-910]